MAWLCTTPVRRTLASPSKSPLARVVPNFENGSGPLPKSFLVALHGSTNKRLARGYRVVSIPASLKGTDDFITGFLDKGIVNGRPCDIMGFREGFLLTDDKAGIVYYVYPKN